MLPRSALRTVLRPTVTLLAQRGGRALWLGVCLAFAGCAADDDEGGATSGAEGSESGSGTATEGLSGGANGAGTSGDATEGGTTAGVTSDDPSAGTTGGTTSGTTGTTTGDETTTGGTTTGNDPNAMPAELPTAVATCPTFEDGVVEFEFGDGRRRRVQLFMREGAPIGNGPLVFYWHGTGSSPTFEPTVGLGRGALDRILDEGGIVAAPFSDPEAGQFPWFLVLGTRTDDLELADQVLACAIEGPGIDVRRIHSVGMSAGGLQTSQMSLRRSNYIASVAVYSGGAIAFDGIPNADPTNLFPAMTFHGGETDRVVIGFKDTTEIYVDELRAAGHFAFICDHGRGHAIPIDGTASAWQFMADHPYGTFNSPYADGLPADFPAYCAL